ncbi:hypothetical protein HYPSUDRAFT_189695 [Hypholoma sublateritium FD-334 SS-4]|uniref:glutathione transferase n=1 Tax=Hypholoma sublateritium (strain FD-334 SS-4) TaxID=945553 RepID=A0A0D2KZ62_HYPSF|nr:hypothetical protein HYPSUDRAFT_189695 [Hypholoma sublateritium FD-334 SS-4]
MVLKLYGSAYSTCTRRVALVLHEKQVPFEFCPIALEKGEHKREEFVAKQPFGQVPYIDDDGFILYESRAIAYYVAKKWEHQGTPLIPTELKANAIFQQAASVELAHFNQYVEKAVIEMVFKPLSGTAGDPEIFKALIKSLSEDLDVYDRILSKQKYVAGDEITLADLYHIPYGSMLPEAGSLIMDEKPNVKRWFDNLSARPSWQAVKGEVKSTA